jgi:glycosyltransferase involved in cell wall biosynthesis
MRVALFAPYLPAPAHSGGRIRIQAFARALAEIAEVSLFASAGAEDIERHGVDAGFELYASTHFTKTARAWLGSAHLPARVRRCGPPALRSAFERAHAERRFDVAVVEHAYAAAVPMEVNAVPWVLDEHNVESHYARERLRARGPLNELMARREVRALARWERRVWGSAAHVVCVSEGDADEIALASGRRPSVIPNGALISRTRFVPPSWRSGYEILFIGLMGHEPNAAAAHFLAKEVLPLLQQLEPRAKLVLCGADPTPAVRRLAGPSVEVTGRVASVQPYLDRAAVYANPLQYGAGTSLKVLEALASGIPLVSSASGVRGFALKRGEDYSAAESAEEFARCLVRCLRDRGACDAAAERNRAFAEAHDFSVLSRRFAELVANCARAERRSVS